MFQYVGDFGENKDVAKKIRIEKIMPTLSGGGQVELDFKDVSGVTQSFIHALIADAIREFKDEIFDRLVFKNCTRDVKIVVEIVAEYMQEGMD